MKLARLDNPRSNSCDRLIPPLPTQPDFTIALSPHFEKMISFFGGHFVINFLQRVGKEALFGEIPSIIGKTANAGHKEPSAEGMEET
jgi:hypothetical protein